MRGQHQLNVGINNMYDKKIIDDTEIYSAKKESNLGEVFLMVVTIAIVVAISVWFWDLVFKGY